MGGTTNIGVVNNGFAVFEADVTGSRTTIPRERRRKGVDVLVVTALKEELDAANSKIDAIVGK